MTRCLSRGPGCAAIALALVACSSRSAPSTAIEVARAWPSPAADVGELCADVETLRVCWDASGRPTVVPRALPPRPAPTPLGFRCSGQGAARVCAPRDDVGPFVCDGGTCVQAHPRQPDDGQWQCTDDAGVTVCVGGGPAAGVVATPAAAGWICGFGPPAPGGEARRVCIDLSPDFPGGAATALRCRGSANPAPLRTCTRDPEAHVLGDACDADHPCVVGSSCAAGRCVPPRPRADCALPGDCARGACRFGSCARGAQ